MKRFCPIGRTVAVVALAFLTISCRCREGTRVPKGVRYLGKITELEIRESSGVAASRRYEGVFWTHNDSNNPEVLYAITRHGVLLGKWRIKDMRMADWEDITFQNDETLLVADIGDNRLWRRLVRVHAVKEPNPAQREGTVSVEHSWVLKFPAGARNCESIFVLGTNAYLVSKRKTASAEVYRFPLVPTTNVITLELVAEINVGSRVTSTAVSRDLKLLALTSARGASAYRIDGDVSRVNGAVPEHVTRFRNRQIEGCTFVPDGLLATSETRHMYLFTNSFFRCNQRSQSDAK